jgi:hypothetical protein
MRRPSSGIGQIVSAPFRAIGRAFLFVGRVVERVVHSIGAVVRG